MTLACLGVTACVALGALVESLDWGAWLLGVFGL